MSKLRIPLPLTNQQLWEMAKVITKKQKAANDLQNDNVDWDVLEEMWFNWLEEELFGSDT